MAQLCLAASKEINLAASYDQIASIVPQIQSRELIGRRKVQGLRPHGCAVARRAREVCAHQFIV